MQLVSTMFIINPTSNFTASTEILISYHHQTKTFVSSCLEILGRPRKKYLDKSSIFFFDLQSRNAHDHVLIIAGVAVKPACNSVQSVLYLSFFLHCTTDQCGSKPPIFRVLESVLQTTGTIPWARDQVVARPLLT